MLALILASVLAIQATPAQMPEPVAVPTRLNSQDIYCGGIAVVLTEFVQANPTHTTAEEDAIMTTLLYYLGRVQGSMPQGQAGEAIIEMAGVLDSTTVSASDINACAVFMRDEGQDLLDHARDSHRSLR